MKTKQISTKELGEWLGTFRNLSTEQEYGNYLHALRCVFDAGGDEEFWNEACAFAIAYKK